MFVEQLVNQLATGIIKAGIRLVEQPDLALGHQQAGQPETTLLARRQRPCRPEAQAGQPDAGHGPVDVHAGPAAEAGTESQVFATAQVTFHCREVAEKGQAARPRQLAAGRLQNTGQNAEQGGLAAAIGAGDHQRLPGGQAHVSWLEDQFAGTGEADLIGPQQLAHRRKMRPQGRLGNLFIEQGRICRWIACSNIVPSASHHKLGQIKP